MNRNKPSPPLQWMSILFLSFIFIVASGAFERVGQSSIAWAFVYISSFIYIAFDYRLFISGIKLAWPAIIFGAFILLSTFWSEMPSRTLPASIQYIYTIVIAIWVGMRFKCDEIFLSILAGFGIVISLSILSGYYGFIDTYSQSEYEGSPRYMIGIFTQKNVFGIAINFLLLAASYFSIKKPKMIIPFYFFALLLLIPLIKSSSSGALIIYLGTIAIPLFWYLFKYKNYRLFIILLTWIVLLSTFFLILSLDIQVVSSFLNALGKDNSLTGRTTIWDIGLNVLNDHLFFGVGYGAFWESGVFQEVSVIHTLFHGQEIKSFHNAYLETAVALGFTGLSLFIFVLLFSLYNTVYMLFKTNNPDAFILTYMIILFVFLSSIESIMTKQHSLHTLMVVVALTITRRELNAISNNKQNAEAVSYMHR